MAAASSAAPSIPRRFSAISCWQALGELRYDLPTTPLITKIQFYGFTDYGKVYTREPAVGTDATAHGASAGGGLRMALLENLYADLQVAKAISFGQNNFNADLQTATATTGVRNGWRFFYAVTAKY